MRTAILVSDVISRAILLAMIIILFIMAFESPCKADDSKPWSLPIVARSKMLAAIHCKALGYRWMQRESKRDVLCLKDKRLGDVEYIGAVNVELVIADEMAEECRKIGFGCNYKSQ